MDKTCVFLSMIIQLSILFSILFYKADLLINLSILRNRFAR